MKSVISLLCIPLCLCLSSMTYAQPEFELRVINPAGFVAPGQSEDIIVEVINPADSGVSITGFSGSGRRGNIPMSPVDMETMRERMLAQARARAEARMAGRCGDYEICPVSGSFPIEPGQSMQIRYLRFDVPMDTPINTEIKLSQLSLKIEIDGESSNSDYYTDNDVIRLVTSTGQGDFSIFDGMNLESQLAGTLSSDLMVTFNAPAEITAGEPFNISARISNQGANTIILHNVLRSSVSGFYSIQGTHRRSFRFVPCADNCLLSGRTTLEPGDSISYEIGTYYYENDELFDGELILDSYRLYVGDTYERDGHSLPQDSPLTINVISPYSGVVENNLNLLPAVQQLEQRDLLPTGYSPIIYDPNTGNEWLQLTVSDGYTEEEMEVEMKPGGNFEDFRIASSAEVEELILNHIHSTGHNLAYYALYQTSDRETGRALISFLDLFGRIDSAGSSIGAIGRVYDPGSSSIKSTSDLFVIQITARDEAAVIATSLDGLRKYTTSVYATNFDYIGYWLVR